MTKEKKTLTPMELRKRVGLTQRQVAIALDKKVATISDWERGVTRPRLTFSETKMLMAIFECTLDELIEAYEREKVQPK
ncbi:helix-turn-helix domain-containing protein [Halotia branconii]|uniref:Helix-turn-helix transcriptional regulator n=1 Tax=Halotia branconii CENA392 TaxID=1539056 RepID=A0AAJ6NT12_9CYAN|nr:helix-turn-helix transcriptional regulator [Halotia branconii]WGV25986.1 helix-turn-helix transcriptional regulator [Halotia branconii CENA392]